MSQATTASQKPVHTIVLDAGPILKNIPPLSTLLAQCEELVTTPSVINEIRDPDARSRVETMYLPFLKQRTPTPNSVKIMSEFARKTGDRAVLSKVDIEVLALAYEIECERNGGDWRLRSVPGQKGLNGKPPAKAEEKKDEPEPSQGEEKAEGTEVDSITKELESTKLDGEDNATGKANGGTSMESNAAAEVSESDPAVSQETQQPQEAQETQEAEVEEEEDDLSDSGSEGGWITPSNLKKRQARDEAVSASATPEPKVMQVATITTDFAVSSLFVI